MEKLLETLISLAVQRGASDIHFTCRNHTMCVQLRTQKGMETLHQDLWSPVFFNYLKYLSGMDLTNPGLPQSGAFTAKQIPCRFSILTSGSTQTGVLRLQGSSRNYPLETFFVQSEIADFFTRVVHMRQGLVVLCGPTGSGKSTLLHALLERIAQTGRKAVSLEDPIEIPSTSYIQLQVQQSAGLTLEKGIEELLRHDPDVLCIQETRTPSVASKVYRAALTGHLTFTTLHAADGKECLARLLDFGLTSSDLRQVLAGIVTCRLYASPAGKECVYELVQRKEIDWLLRHQDYPPKARRLWQEIQAALDAGRVEDVQACLDIQDLRR